MSKVRVDVNRRNMAVFDLIIEVRDVKQLSRILDRLEGLDKKYLPQYLRPRRCGNRCIPAYGQSGQQQNQTVQISGSVEVFQGHRAVGGLGYPTLGFPVLQQPLVVSQCDDRVRIEHPSTRPRAGT